MSQEPDATDPVSENQSLEAAQPAPLEPRASKAGFSPVAAAILGIFVGLIAGIVIGMNGAPKPLEARKPIVLNLQMNGQPVQIVGNPVSDLGWNEAMHTLGQGTAKITMVEFGDYHCGYCRLYENETFPKLKAEFVDSGKLRYAYRHTVSVGGQQTVAVSNAATCVADQGKFWDFHNLLFSQQERWIGLQPGAQLNSTLAGLAQQIGVKQDQLASCLTAQPHAKKIEADIAAASAFGITGTPSFVINGYEFTGALPYEFFKEIFKHFGVS
jgi:protein-disulfide isomerase